MKLILKEYLASLRERDELDAILPDLLSQLGFTVLSKPQRGTRQHGVDVAAVGALNGGPKKLYLFSIKSGDLTRAEWSAGPPQNLRPSLDEIQDSYLRSHVPGRYRDLDVVICICIGGIIREEVQSDVTGYTDRATGEGITFEVWNGDILADHILDAFLREELLPENVQSHLRKAVALVEEPDEALRHMDRLMKALLEKASTVRTRKITALRQILIALWVLYAWCRSADNVKAALLASERALLLAWDAAKEQFGVKTKNAKTILRLAQEISFLHLRISEYYLETKIFPHTAKRSAISSAVRSSNAVDVNLRLFALLGQIALAGLWHVYYRDSMPAGNEEAEREINTRIALYADKAAELINHNPVLFSPLQDNHVVDIHIAAILFATIGRHSFLLSWLEEIIKRIDFSLFIRRGYPCIYFDYRDLVQHPKAEDDEYFKGATAASVLYPTIAVWAALFGYTPLFNRVADLQNEHLQHSTFQLWFPGDDTEEAIYAHRDRDNHGIALTGFDFFAGPEVFLDDVFDECEKNKAFSELSAIRTGVWPMLLTACRHYRLPVPIYFLVDAYKARRESAANKGDASEAAETV